MSDYDNFIGRVKELNLIGSLTGLMGWDQETMMPPKGGKLRSEMMAFLSKQAHSRITDSEMGKLLDSLESEKLTEEQAANVREIRRAYDKATKLPEELVEEKARHKSQALQVWQEARAENDFEKTEAPTPRPTARSATASRSSGLSGGPRSWTPTAGS